MEKVKVTIGQWLKAGRKLKGLTLQDVSDMTNGFCSVSYISRLESDSRKNPSIDKLQSLAHALELDINEVIDDVPNIAVVKQTKADKELTVMLEEVIPLVKEAITLSTQLNDLVLLEGVVAKRYQDEIIQRNALIQASMKVILKEMAYLQLTR